MGTETGWGSLGCAVINCPACGQPRRVEIIGNVSPIRRPDDREVAVYDEDSLVGVVYYRLGARRDPETPHVCRAEDLLAVRRKRKLTTVETPGDLL